MDYTGDEGLAALLSLSDDINQRSKAASERSAQQSAALRSLLERSDMICSDSAVLCEQSGSDERAEAAAARRARRLRRG